MRRFADYLIVFVLFPIVIEPRNLGNTVTAPATINPGDYLQSTNGQYRADMQPDGNFVIYYDTPVPNNAIWTTKTQSRSNGPYKMVMQPDNNVLLYDMNGNDIWRSRTARKGVSPARLIMEDDGNLVLWDAGSKKIWQSKWELRGKVNNRKLFKNRN